jgi:hypothetical protein
LAKSAISTTGSEDPTEAKPAISSAGKSISRKSQCEPLAELIKAAAMMFLPVALLGF